MMQWIFALALLPLVAQGYIIKEDESFLQLPHYTSQEQLEDLFARLAKAYPEQARVHSIGRSLEGRNLLALQISRNARQRPLLTPPVKYIANMHGDETVGRQLLVYLAQYLLGNYERSLEIGQLVNTTDIFLMPTMNPDGYALSQVRALSLSSPVSSRKPNNKNQKPKKKQNNTKKKEDNEAD